jgi:hypothetical protein
MTRFGVISDVYGASNQVTISNYVDRSAIKKFRQKSRFWFLLDASIADSFRKAKRNGLIRPLNHLNALFKSQQNRTFENSPDRPQLDRKGADTMEVPGIPGRF